MMHIAIDARIINSSTGRYVERLLHYLEKIDDNHRYTVLVRAKDTDFWKPSSPRFTIKVADFDDYSFGEQLGFKKLLDELKPDLVHFCMPQQPILYTGKKVTTVHDLTLLKTYNSDKNWLIFHAKQLVGRFVFKRIARTNNHILTPSQFTKDEYLNLTHIASEKITVTYESADIPAIEPEKYPHPFKRYILYVGQQSDYKNIKRLGDAHQLLLERFPDLELILVGKLNASAQQNKTHFEKNNYKNIHFTGFVSDAQLAWLYKNAEAYVFPSLMEGFGLPGLEAMQYNVPLVSSNATCLPEVYGPAAHYFDPLDTQDIVRAINEMLSDEPLRSSLVAAGKKQRQKYSWQRMAEQTHSIYEQVLSE